MYSLLIYQSLVQLMQIGMYHVKCGTLGVNFVCDLIAVNHLATCQKLVEYRKVASSNTSRLEPHPCFNRLFTLKSLIEEQTEINEQAWKKVPPCFLIY